jgi:hypothetical protein
MVRAPLRVVKDRGSDADAQELVADIAGNLGRAAKPVEVALAGAGQIIRRPVKRLQVQNGEGFLECLHGCAKDLLDDLARRIIRRYFGMKGGGVGVVIVDQPLTKLAKAGKPQLFGDIDHHRLGHRRHLAFQRGKAWQSYPDLRAHSPWITHLYLCLPPPAPEATLSISMATMMMIPVASNW